jgi:hypothetical protein
MFKTILQFFPVVFFEHSIPYQNFKSRFFWELYRHLNLLKAKIFSVDQLTRFKSESRQKMHPIKSSFIGFKQFKKLG